MKSGNICIFFAFEITSNARSLQISYGVDQGNNEEKTCAIPDDITSITIDTQKLYSYFINNINDPNVHVENVWNQSDIFSKQIKMPDESLFKRILKSKTAWAITALVLISLSVLVILSMNSEETKIEPQKPEEIKNTQIVDE